MTIMILTCKFGSGHLSAAQTLKRQIESYRPSDQVLLLDLIELCFPSTYEWIYQSYQKLILAGAKVVQHIYGENPQKALSEKASSFEKMVLTNLFRRLDELQPQVVISTYSLASKSLARYKQSHPEAFQLITCITDVKAHQGWINKETDLYLVACQRTKEDLLSEGVTPERIIVQGIPVRHMTPKHSETASKQLLVMGGGLGLLPHSQRFYKQLQVPDWSVTVVCGKNRKLYRKLSKLGLSNFTVLGYVNHIEELLQQADLILSKPGGVTTFEAIGAEIPLLSFSPTLPQEMTNADFISEHHFGMILPKKMRQIPETIAQVLSHPEFFEQTKENMRQFSLSLRTDGLKDYLGALS